MCDVCDEMKRSGLPATAKNFDDVAERLGHGRPNMTTSGTNQAFYPGKFKDSPHADPDALKDANEEATAQYLAKTKHGIGNLKDGLKHQLESIERQLARMVAEGAPVAEVQRKNEMIEAAGDNILRVLKRAFQLAERRKGNGDSKGMDAVMRDTIEKIAKNLGMKPDDFKVERLDFAGKR